MTKELICINCPAGCLLTVSTSGEEGSLSVEGNGCGRGIEYGKQEAVRPLRTLTGNVIPKGTSAPLSCRTTKPVPKDLLLRCAMALKELHPSLPVHAGDILAESILGTGADIMATADMTHPRLS